MLPRAANEVAPLEPMMFPLGGNDVRLRRNGGERSLREGCFGVGIHHNSTAAPMAQQMHNVQVARSLAGRVSLSFLRSSVRAAT